MASGRICQLGASNPQVIEIQKEAWEGSTSAGLTCRFYPTTLLLYLFTAANKCWVATTYIHIVITGVL